MRNRIRLDTVSDMQKFVDITSKVEGKVTVTDGNGLCVNAKSILGIMYTAEFNELWIESEVDIYNKISEFVILESY